MRHNGARIHGFAHPKHEEMQRRCNFKSHHPYIRVAYNLHNEHPSTWNVRLKGVGRKLTCRPSDVLPNVARFVLFVHTERIRQAVHAISFNEFNEI